MVETVQKFRAAVARKPGAPHTKIAVRRLAKITVALMSFIVSLALGKFAVSTCTQTAINPGLRA
jgi:hypothetical protein